MGWDGMGGEARRLINRQEVKKSAEEKKSATELKISHSHAECNPSPMWYLPTATLCLFDLLLVCFKSYSGHGASAVKSSNT
jgi:hypothetical protein